MEERVLGAAPSEGSVSGRRFGIYRSYSPDPKLHSINKLILVFFTAVAAVVGFSIIYPVMQYATRANRKSAPLPYPEIPNNTISNGEESQIFLTRNCSANVFSFGNDCTETFPKLTEEKTPFLTTESGSLFPDVRRFDDVSTSEREDDDSEGPGEDRGFKNHRRGRNRWPPVSTPYPYHTLPTVTPTPTSHKDDLSPQETIFAVPSDSVVGEHRGSSSSRVNFTPPPYAFTPFPNFTDSYAQLSPYKVPQNNTNFYEVMKYLNEKVATDRKFPVEHPGKTSRNRSPLMKVTGTYMRPLDKRRPGEILISSGSDSTKQARPFFNGHTYVSDLFNEYRPSNPGDINRLIPVKSSMDVGPRFRKPVSFVPTSSVDVDISPSVSPNIEELKSAGSHTLAIFHPPAVVSQKPPLLPRPTTTGPSDKPLSVTLDIYPVTLDDDEPEPTVLPVARERGRLNPKWRPKATERPRWHPQAHSRRPSSALGPDNHMIVHLNLFPNKRRPYYFPRRLRDESVNTTVLPGGQFSERQDSVVENADAVVNEEEKNGNSSLSFLSKDKEENKQVETSNRINVETLIREGKALHNLTDRNTNLKSKYMYDNNTKINPDNLAPKKNNVERKSINASKRESELNNSTNKDNDGDKTKSQPDNSTARDNSVDSKASNGEKIEKILTENSAAIKTNVEHKTIHISQRGSRLNNSTYSDNDGNKTEIQPENSTESGNNVGGESNNGDKIEYNQARNLTVDRGNNVKV